MSIHILMYQAQDLSSRFIQTYFYVDVVAL